MATSAEIVAIAGKIWPTAKNIEVTPYKADRSTWSGSETPEGFKLTVSNEVGGVMAQVIAGSLAGLKAKLEKRSTKKHWGVIFK